MRICLVSRELSPFNGGGIGTYVAHAGRALTEAGHEVHLLTDRHPSIGETRSLPWGGVIHYVNLDRAETRIDAYPMRAMRYAMAVHMGLEELHASHRFDLVEFPEWGGEGYFSLRARKYLAALPGAVLAVRLHTPSRDCREMNRQSWLDNAAASVDHMEDECIRLAELVLSPTQSLLDRVQLRLGRMTATRVIPHPFYVDATTETAAEITVPRARILYFGRIEHRKGVHLLVEAAQVLLREGVDLQLDLVGADTSTGPCGRGFQAFLEENIDEPWRDRIRFHGAKLFEELKIWIRGATVCCFPSLWENFPNTCLEAMALGGVIVASDSGGMADIVENRVSGLLFRSNEVQSLAGALKKALSNSALRGTLRSAAQQRVRVLCEPGLFAQRVEQARANVRTVSVDLGNEEKPSTVADVTVIVLHRGAPEYLASTLASVCAQSLEVRCLWVLSVGTADPDTSAHVERYGARIHHTPQRSAAAVRNIGLNLGTSRWVMFVEAGDLLETTFVEKTLSAVEREPAAALATSLTTFLQARPGDVAMGWCPWGTGQGWIVASHPWARGGTLVAREEALSAGGYDEWVADFAEWDLYCTLSERGMTAAVIPEFLLHRRIGDTERFALPSEWYRGMAAVIEKHPRLAGADHLTARFLLGELHRAGAHADGRQSLRHLLVTRFTGIIRRVPRIYRALRQVATQLDLWAHGLRRIARARQGSTQNVMPSQRGPSSP